MKLRIISDIHMEHGGYELPVLDGEKEQILILAGDINQGIDSFPFINRCLKRFKHIIYVPGNHEYYFQESIESVNADLKQYANQLDNITVLLDEAVKLYGQWFWGGTFWTDMGAGDWHIRNAIKRGMNDFKLIRRFHDKKLKPVKFDINCAEYFHKQAAAKLTNHLVNCKEKTVVITHHAPSHLSVDDCFKGSMLNYAYHPFNFDQRFTSSGLDDKVSTWIHGHMHNKSDYMMGNTRVLCNPVGYPDSYGNRAEHKHLVVEV